MMRHKPKNIWARFDVGAAWTDPRWARDVRRLHVNIFPWFWLCFREALSFKENSCQMREILLTRSCVLYSLQLPFVHTSIVLLRGLKAYSFAHFSLKCITEKVREEKTCLLPKYLSSFKKFQHFFSLLFEFFKDKLFSVGRLIYAYNHVNN